MRMLLVALLVVAACHSASLPGDGDGGAPADLARRGDGGGNVCAILCTMGFTCCDGACVNVRNDIRNCGVCGNVCAAPNDFCDGTSCAPPPCSPPCGAGMLCCDVRGPGPSRPPACTTPTASGTCPLGCPLCL
jgi:hypothetical protein